MCRLQRLQIVGKKPERAHVQSQKKQSALEISTWEKKKHSPALRRGGGGIDPSGWVVQECRHFGNVLRKTWFTSKIGSLQFLHPSVPDKSNIPSNHFYFCHCSQIWIPLIKIDFFLTGMIFKCFQKYNHAL